MPIGHDYTIIERAVYIAAWAGCSSIWIVCSDDNLLLLKKRVGNWIFDPESILRAMLLRKKSMTGFQRITRIPIIYVPIHPKDIGRRDGLVWSALWGAKVAYHISGSRSYQWQQAISVAAGHISGKWHWQNGSLSDSMTTLQLGSLLLLSNVSRSVVLWRYGWWLTSGYPRGHSVCYGICTT
jgi:hypothetical protein